MNEQEVLAPAPVLAIDVEEIVVQEGEEVAVEEGEEVGELEEVGSAGSAVNKFCSRVERPIAKGKNKGKMALHFKCNYCIRAFVGPSNSSFTTHLKKDHPRACPELFVSTTATAKPKKDFFNPVKMLGPYNEDIMMVKLVKLIVRSDLPFSIVDDDNFQDFVNYLKRVNGKSRGDLMSRRTIMRRVDEMFVQKSQEVKDMLNRLQREHFHPELI